MSNKMLVLALAVVGLHSIHFQAQENAFVIVNGRRIPSRVIGGQVFVTPEDFAKAIGATLSYSGSELNIITGLEKARYEAPVPTSGTIKGTLSYYFNSNYGNKPDAGSKIFLVPKDFTISANELFFSVRDEIEVFGRSAGQRKYTVTKKTVADGSGNFELAALPEGEYTLFIESNHTQDSGYHPKRITKHVTIKGSNIIDASEDFGVSY